MQRGVNGMSVGQCNQEGCLLPPFVKACMDVESRVNEDRDCADDLYDLYDLLRIVLIAENKEILVYVNALD